MNGTRLMGLAALACLQAAPAAHAEVADTVVPGQVVSEPAAASHHFDDAELAGIVMPETAFTETALIAADYDKYFYFQRDDTSIDQAYADVIECDALASGVSYYGGDGVTSAAFVQYGVLPSALGGALGSVIADAIVGSAERRRIRRVNIRNCMGFKGYDRFGLEKELWQDFNFEEGFSREDADSRALSLKRQARRAAGPKPQQKVLQP